jgi:hypothetical protein
LVEQNVISKVNGNAYRLEPPADGLDVIDWLSVAKAILTAADKIREVLDSK